ncbi:N-acylethanolamine-hydrolyzing acid amidase-like isoform X1 [Anneissia japonica]|uniref:N-acylethanolamine-hydrolyzing acid amidase-like isoform X1 n=1 Tax=Anneissia japonica TaxID=1529436 RepID=UPI0014259710|nr:N-acylethanolamine-hydrolyzing acid amidase-like isoform X1 [Anneissia japonica]
MEAWKTKILFLAVFTSTQTCIHSYIIKSSSLLITSPPLLPNMTKSSRPSYDAPPRYNFDLDLPDEQRWVSILRHYDKDNLKQMIRDALSIILPKQAFPLVDLIGSQLNKYMPDPYAGEIRGIANWLDISVGEIFAMNLIYEATAFCTSIIAVNHNNMVWHGRNLDYSHFSDILRNTTVVLNFQRNNHTVFTSTSFVANVGIHTGMKPNVFTVSINERSTVIICPTCLLNF